MTCSSGKLQRLAEKESAFEMLTLLHLQDEMRNETERVSPDTIGCDAFFVRYFVNESMEEDFGVIANAFYKNVPESMDFHNYDYYTDIPLNTLYLLKKKYPKKDITKEDLMCHAVLYFTADVLADSMMSGSKPHSYI